MGLAKSATEVAQDSLKVLQNPVSDGVMATEDIHIIHPEAYSYFNINSSDDNPGLDKVVSWAKEEAKTPSEVLNKINNLETKLGQPGAGETRLSKLSNWVRMTQSIKDVDLTYRDQMENIRGSHKKSLTDIAKNKGEELKKLNSHISNIESKYDNVYHATRARTMDEMGRIKEQYKAQLKELKAMRAVYQRSK